VLESVDCRAIKPPSIETKCYDLIVPEDRAKPEGRTIRLHVAVIKSTSPQPSPDPILFLSGGPGFNAINNFVMAGLTFQAFRGNRDMIVFDQRGTGKSQPVLACPELYDAEAALAPLLVDQVEGSKVEKTAMQACRDRLGKQGIQLDAYTTSASAADADDLRRALKIEKWNLYGFSYGTHLGLTILRDYPDGVRSAVLDSVWPLQKDIFVLEHDKTQGIYEQLFKGCAANAKCQAAYPRLEDTFYEAITRLNKEPVNVTVVTYFGQNIKPGTDIPMDGSRFIDTVFAMLLSDSTIPYVPKLIATTALGDNTLLARYNATTEINHPDFYAAGMNMSVVCADRSAFPAQTPEQIAAEKINPLLLDLASARNKSEVEFCQLWGSAQESSLDRQPLSSDIPTLILAGEYDPSTPLAWGRLAATTLRKGYFVEFPNIGHGVYASDSATNGCANRIVTAFYEEPDTQPDISCVSKIKQHGFITSP
jgi:pimeloyl-ACP methyl ester carboxylesterase